MNRREFLPLAGAGLLAGYAGWSGGKGSRAQPAGADVAVVRAASYQSDLAGAIGQGLTACGLDVMGKKILLVPHLAGIDETNAMNTHAWVLAAAYAVLLEMGAAQVRVGAGPETYRDTLALTEAAGYRDSVPNFDDVFVDLNADDVAPVEGFEGRKEIYLPVSAVSADLVVSLAKMKIDATAGASLSMMNLLSLIPAHVYGWPPSQPPGPGGGQAATELTRLFRRSFGIVDGVVGMEGEMEKGGPFPGTAKAAGVLAMGSDLAAVDATCCRIMEIDPTKVEHLRLAAAKQGVIDEERIEQRGETIASVRTRFSLPKSLAALRLS